MRAPGLTVYLVKNTPRRRHFLKSFSLLSFLSGCKSSAAKVTVQILSELFLKLLLTTTAKHFQTQPHSLAGRKDTRIGFNPASHPKSIFNFLSACVQWMELSTRGRRLGGLCAGHFSLAGCKDTDIDTTLASVFQL